MNIPQNRLGLPQTIWWTDGELYLLDQRQLPTKVVGRRQNSVDEVFNSIRTLTVRGAPAIGVAAAYGLLVDRETLVAGDVAAMRSRLRQRAEHLESSRPTAVNLRWSLQRMIKFAETISDREATPDSIYERLVTEAISIHDEDRQLCRDIGRHGRSLITDGMGILTHCNAGSLATSEFGTATAPMYLAHQDKVRFRVFVDETRPLLQGSRLTAWELDRSGIDTTLICDNMAASMFAAGRINAVIVGTDRVAANGDVANKIGTLAVAILAKHFGASFYVAVPYSTIDPETKSGEKITIEQRDASEVRQIAGQPIAPPNVNVANPAFDVTPSDLVTAFITERGILYPPYDFSQS